MTAHDKINFVLVGVINQENCTTQTSHLLFFLCVSAIFPKTTFFVDKTSLFLLFS